MFLHFTTVSSALDALLAKARFVSLLAACFLIAHLLVRLLCRLRNNKPEFHLHKPPHGNMRFELLETRLDSDCTRHRTEKRDMAAVNHQASDCEGAIVDTEAKPTFLAAEMDDTTTINPTSTTTMGIAAEKVFDTPELLEQILLNLDPIGLHVLQRVSACFKDTMSASPKIRQHMFLQMRQEGLCGAAEQLLLDPRVRGKLGPLEFTGVRLVMGYTDSILILELDVSEDWFKAQAKLCTSGWWVPAECTAWKGRVAGLSWNKLRVTAEEVGVQVTLHCGHLEKSDCLHIEEPTLHDLLQHAWRLFLKMNDEMDLLHRTIMW